MGTSVLIVARNLEKVINSRFVSTFVFRAPFSWSVCSKKIFDAYRIRQSTSGLSFSPTPGQPGMLSDASPISPKHINNLGRGLNVELSFDLFDTHNLKTVSRHA
nr:hypothetical protein [Bacteroides nordii]